MPYDQSATDRAKVERMLRSQFDGKVPPKAVDQFIEVFNGVDRVTGDEGRGFAAAYSVVRRRHDTQHAQMPVAVATVGRALAVAVGRRVLLQMEDVLSKCDCGKEHEKALLSIRYALRLGAGKIGAPTNHPSMALHHAAAKEVGVNKRMVWKMIAKNIYSTGDRLFLAVREMLQNSRDARAKNITLTWTETSSIESDLRGTLVFADDGKGMSIETLDGKFLVLGESEKEEGDLGGFGAAKAAILTAAISEWEWDVRTRNVHAYALPSGEFESFEVPETIQGTRITIPNMRGGYMRTPMGGGHPVERITSIFSTSDMRGIHVLINGSEPESYFGNRRGRREELYEGFGWGECTVSIKSYARSNEDGGAIIVRVKGLAQFAIPAEYGTKLPRDYVLDFEIPKHLKPNDNGYPFEAGRDRFAYSSPAAEAFRKMKGLILTSTGEKDANREYQEIAPDSSDPRERKADAQFGDMMNKVLDTKGFSDVFENLAESARELQQTLKKAIGGGGVKVVEIFPGEHERPEGDGSIDSIEQSVVTLFSVEVLDAVELIPALRGWFDIHLESDRTSADNALHRLEQNAGWADDLTTISNLLTAAFARLAPGTSKLESAWVISQVLKRLEVRVASWEVAELKRKKKRGELNPFGGAAIIMISTNDFGQERGKQFLKDAKKYMRHLVWWDFTVRSITKALSAAGLINVDPGIGFVLDDTVLGLCRRDGQYVMVNPIALAAIVDQFSDRAFIPASYIHGVACHEIAHAQRIQTASDGKHNEHWSVLRENWASKTLFLIPVIEAAGAKLLRMKRRRQPRVRDASKESEAMTARLAELESRLSEARVELNEAHRSTDPVLTNLRKTAAQLEELVKVEEFRGWVQANPELLEPHGIDVEHFLEVLQSPGGITSMIRTMNSLPTPTPEDVEDAKMAWHAACGCLGPTGEAEADRWGGHSACPGCRGTCGGDAESHAPSRVAAWELGDGDDEYDAAVPDEVPVDEYDEHDDEYDLVGSLLMG